MNQEIFAKRRAKFLTQIGKGVAVVFSAPHAIRNADTHYKYRTDSSFFYLTGFSEPESIAIFAPETDAPYRLFVPPKDPLRELWDGKRLGVDGAKTELKPDLCYPTEDFDKVFRELLKRAGKVFYPVGGFPEIDSRMLKYVSEFRPRVRDGEKLIQLIGSTINIVGELRKKKDAAEIDLMRKNCRNSALSYIDVMKYTKPGLYEYQVEAKINQRFVDGGAETLAYGSIIAGGANATVLHYVSNRDVLKDGSLLLIDAGGEMCNYASDITRTYPVNGRYSFAQKQVYEVVLAAQKAAIAEARVGAPYSNMHKRSIEVLVDGMLGLNILKGTREECIRNKTYAKYFPHGTGHWLGLDVHDSGTYYTEDGESILLEEGHVMTVEPGLYFGENETSVAPEFRGIGIRIEDDILVTANGPENLTIDAPKEIAEIEAIVGRG